MKKASIHWVAKVCLESLAWIVLARVETNFPRWISQFQDSIMRPPFLEAADAFPADFDPLDFEAYKS